MNKKTTTLFITKTAMLLALTVLLQMQGTLWTGGNTFIVGSLVNFMLFVSVMYVSVGGAIIVGLLTPVFAMLLGVLNAILIPIVPLIALGNVIMVVVFYLLVKFLSDKYYIRIAAVAAAAVIKGLYMWFIVLSLVPVILPSLPAPVWTALQFTFAYPQIITALIGGAVALPIFLKRKLYQVSTVSKQS